MGQEPSVPPKGFKDEAAMLREHLKCAVHHQYCFVMQDTQSIRAWHEKIVDYEIDLWAKLWAKARVDDSSTNQNDHELIPDNLGVVAVYLMCIFITITPHQLLSHPIQLQPNAQQPHLLFPLGGGYPIHYFLQTKRPTAPSSSTSFITAVPEKDSASSSTSTSGFDEALFCQPVTPLDQAFSGISGTSALDTQSIDHLLQNIESNNDSVVVTYPSVMTVLNLMDRQCSSSSSSHRMASYYCPLMEYGFGYVHNVTLLAYDYDFFVDFIDMPRDHVRDFIEICRSITLHAKQSQM
ncbi:hypothetical protein EV368DRAFT_90128 [Lentinula lateritia]|nr:hypothetical protein EV368DRAFT_90128 [Lentinula lateritia]